MAEIVHSAPYFEDLVVGQLFDSPGVTITDGRTAMYQAIFGDRLMLPMDHHLCRDVTGRERVMAHPLLVTNIAIGQSTYPSQRVKANLFYRGLRHIAPVWVGDTIRTSSTIIALKVNSSRPGRAPTGLVLLEVVVRDSFGEVVLKFLRCPMLPVAEPELAEQFIDDIDKISAEWLECQSPIEAFEGWDIAQLLDQSPGCNFDQIEIGDTHYIDAVDPVILHSTLVRSTLNIAQAHSDNSASFLGQRLVYGGYIISMAFAQMTRIFPTIVTILDWDKCRHASPVVEQDVIRTEVEVLDKKKCGETGGICVLNIRSHKALRGTDDLDELVLDWTFSASLA